MAQQKSSIEFSLLSQNDDLSYLYTKENKSEYEKLKLLKMKSNSTLSFGGSYRYQTEGFLNQQFVANNDDVWLLHRLLLHSQFKWKNKLQIFAELGSSTTTGKPEPDPVDKDVLNINQLLLAYSPNAQIKLTIGRENLLFGSRRLIDIREGPNVRRSFDLARIDFMRNNLKITGVFAVPVKNRDGVFDNEFLNFQEALSGIYFTKNYSSEHNFDVYYLFQKDDNTFYNSTSENERRSSIGLRYFGNYAQFNFNTEGVYQLGTFGREDISAYTISAELEYTIGFANTNATLGLKTEVISGDKNPYDKKQGTFDALYPRGAYFGRVAQFGPANLFDIHPYLNVNFHKFYLETDYVAFWRYSNKDAVYNAAVMPDFPSKNDEYFIGNQLGVLLGFSANNHLNFELESNIIIPGPFLKESHLDNTLAHMVFTAEFKF